MKTSVREDVATVAAGVPRPLLQKDRLDRRLKELEIRGIRSDGMQCCLGGCRSLGATADPVGKHFPFWVVLRSPKLASRVGRIAACLPRQRVKQQGAFQWIGGHDQLADDLKVSA